MGLLLKNHKGYLLSSLVAQMVKSLPAMQETQVPSLGWEDPLEKGMATHCSTLAWKTPRTEEPGGPQSMGSQSRTGLSDFTFTSFLVLLHFLLTMVLRICNNCCGLGL